MKAPEETAGAGDTEVGDCGDAGRTRSWRRQRLWRRVLESVEARGSAGDCGYAKDCGYAGDCGGAGDYDSVSFGQSPPLLNIKLVLHMRFISTK